MTEIRPLSFGPGESERHAQIRAALERQLFATVRDLVALTGASPATIRRDIEKLDTAGMARKVFGGIASLDGAGHREGLSARPFDENRMIAVDAKKAIAAEAERLVRDGDSVIVHGGSTCHLFGTLLARRPVKVFTNSMPLAAHLAEAGICHLTVSGGELHREPGILQAVPGATPDVFASKFFVGAQGLGPEGVMESHPLLKRSVELLLPCTDEVVVLADSRKFAIRARHVVFGLDRIGTLVTDDGLTDAQARLAEDAGITIVVARTRPAAER